MTPQYREYIQQCIELARSLVIKSEHTITVMNNYLESVGVDVGDDPTGWKYYMNLAGEYHHTDTPISVTSSDTGVLIQLTKENLVDHPITRAHYGPGGRKHQALLDNNQSNVILLRRIFNPLVMVNVIGASDHSILYHDPTLVGVGESTLIDNVGIWVHNQMSRWHNRSYSVTDPLYMAGRIATLYQHIPSAITSLRLRAANTPFAGDFHIWSKLGSCSGLARYREHVTHKQALYLYRNIEYIRHNVGKESVMLDLQKNITAPRNITTGIYSITQTEDVLLEDRRTGVTLVKTDYNAVRTSIQLNDRRTARHVYEETTGAGIHNAEDLDRDVEYAHRVIGATTIDVVPSGIIEMVQEYTLDERLATPDTVKFHSWLTLTASSKYIRTVTVPVKGRGDLDLTMLDAAVLLLYTALKLKGLDHDVQIPDILVNSVPAVTLPTVEQLNSVLPKSLVDDGVANELLLLVPQVDVITNDIELDAYTNDIVSTYYKMHLIEIRQQTMRDRARVNMCIHMVFKQQLVTIAPTAMTYKQWASDLNILDEVLTTDEYHTLFTTILSDVVGVDTETSGMSTRARAMVDIVRQLTSYSVNLTESSARRTLMTSMRKGSDGGTVTMVRSDNYYVPVGTDGRSMYVEANMHTTTNAQVTLGTVSQHESSKLPRVERTSTTASMLLRHTTHVTSGNRMVGTSEITILP